MALIEVDDLLENALNGGKVRRKANNTGRLRIAKRVVKASPEVMVKITGFGKGADHIKAHLRYVTRHAKLDLETDRGDVLRGKEGLQDLLRHWTDDIGSAPRYKNQRDTMHMVLSMPEGTPETAVRSAARIYARRVFSGNYEYVFALHTDEPHPHVHLTVKTRGFDGRKLNPRKADLQTWREVFAREMRDQGIEAEATPRSARGVVRKAEKSVLRHIERGGRGRSPRISRVSAARNKEIVEELIAEANGQTAVETPWKSCIKQRQRYVRDAWQSAARILEQHTTPVKEHWNVRPEYDRLDSARVRAGQRAAAVYQSQLKEFAFCAPAVALARMRDMSRLDMVQHQRPVQVLLYADALDRVGRNGSADYDLRRPRTRALTLATATGSDVGQNGRVMPVMTAAPTLAADIWRFVQAMPPLDTQRDVLKQRLAGQFQRHAEIDQGSEEGRDRAIPNDHIRKTPER